jgi:hypothetical protein
MLSAKLVRLIESHWAQITNRALAQIRSSPEMSHLHRLPEAELREWGQHILENLGDGLASGNEAELAARYEQVGRMRFEEAIPLHEAVRALCVLKEKALEFVEEHLELKTIVELYAEEELEHRLGRFFDFMLYHVVRGYEGAMRRAVRVGA